MSITISTSGAAERAVSELIPPLVAERFASRLFERDASLWGQAASEEASKRLGWTRAAEVSRALVPEITQLRETLRAQGIDRIVLCGMGGSSLAPEVLARTAKAELTVLDSTDPAQVSAAITDRLERTAVVVSSKSGSTVETDSQRRAYIAAFEAAGIRPQERIFIVTDPGSPMSQDAEADGYRIFHADPEVGGRFSALTAFGLVPAGLAGVDIEALLDEAAAAAPALAEDAPENPGLVLGAAMTGSPAKTYLGIVEDGTPIAGFGDWAEQLIAESTGKDGTGQLPVLLEHDAPELSAQLPDVQIARLVADAAATPARGDELAVSGPLGAQLLLWEVAVAVAGRLLGINPFDQPDVESAKAAARGLLDAQPAPEPAASQADGIEVRWAGASPAAEQGASAEAAVQALAELVPADGFLAVQAYADRTRLGALASLRSALAKRTGRPVTFGWGPRFLHSTGQFHKGGPAVGAYLQITTDEQPDLEIPGRPFSFGGLIAAQAAGDASVLASHGRPVLRLHLKDPDAGARRLSELLSEPGRDA